MPRSGDRRVRGVTAAAAAGGLLVIAPSWVALGHGVDHPRALEIDVSSRPARLFLTLTLTRAESESTRRLFDRDRDGRLSAGERVTLQRYLEERAWGALTLRCNGRPLKPAVAHSSWQGADDRLELQLRLETTAPLAPSGCTLEDGGDREGHLPVRLTGREVRLDAPRSGAAWNLPARRPTSVGWKP